MPSLKILTNLPSLYYPSNLPIPSFFSDITTTDLLRLDKGTKKPDSSSYLKEQWQNLTQKEKIDELMLQGITEIEEFSNVNFTATDLDQQRHYFFIDLNNDLCDTLMQVWWLLPLKEQRERMKLGLAELALEAHFSVLPEAGYENSYAFLISLFADDDLLTTATFLQELRLYKLKKNVEWITPSNITDLGENPLRLFKAVLVHNKHPFPQADFWTNLPNLMNVTASLAHSNNTNAFIAPPILRSLDETGLIWQQCQTGNWFTGIKENDRQISVDLLHLRFLPRLIEAYSRQKLIDELFTPEPTGGQAIYFDGFVFKNAEGKTFADLVEASELQRVTDYRNLNHAQKVKLIEEFFEQKGESIQFKLGSLEHSLASCLIRLYRYRTHRVPHPFSDIPFLIELFKEAEEQWKNEKDYPIHPRLLLAVHLARTNNVSVEGTTGQQKTKFLLNYIAKQFEHLLDPLQIERLRPSFDSRQAALEIVQGLGMADDEIHRSREYTITRWKVVLAPGSSLSKDTESCSGSAIDEFLAKSRANEVFTFRDQTINPRLELEKKAEDYNERLIHDPWIYEKARASLLSEGTPLKRQLIEQKSSNLANKYRQKTSDHPTWIQDVKTWVMFVPGLGPLETIYEGVQDKNWKEIFVGGLFLSLDAWAISELGHWATNSLFRSAISASRISVREQMTINSLQASLSEGQISLQELAQQDISVNLNQNPFLANPLNSEIGETTLMQEGQVASEQSEPIQMVNGKWIFLQDENRAVLVTQQGKYYREVSWQSGEVDLNKPLISRNSDTGVYTVSESRIITPKRYSIFVESLSKTELRQRYTVKETLQFMERAYDYSTYSDFPTRFRRFFNLIYQSNPSFFNAESYYENLYKNSSTFRRIFNKFVKKAELDPENNVWRIEIGQAQANLQKFQGCHTNLIKKLICIDPQSEFSTVKYVSDNHLGDQTYLGEAFQKERAATHELLHALTNADDLESGSPVIRGSFAVRDLAVARSHRGGIVYLTDKILFEGKTIECIPQRLVYRYFEKDHPLNYDILKSRLVKENNFLDERLDSSVPIEEYAAVGGEFIEQRSVVQKTEAFFAAVGALNPEIDDDDVRPLLEKMIIGEDKNLLDEVYNFFDALLTASRTFRFIFHNGSKRLLNYLTNPFQFIVVNFSKFSAESLLKSETENTAYFFEDGVYYLSEKGIVPLEIKRQFMYKIIEILTDLKLGEPPISAQLLGRSPALQIADKIFREAEMDNYPKCLAEAFVLPGDIDREKELLQNWSWLSRMANFEDKYLDEAVYKKLEDNCLSCNPLRKERSISYTNRTEAVAIAETMRQITETNQKLFLSENTNGTSRILTKPSNYPRGFFKKTILTAALSVGTSIIPSMNQTLD